MEWSDEDIHAEWVDGEVVIHLPPKDIHQVTLGFLYWLLGLIVDLFDLGKLRIAPFEMKAIEDDERVVSHVLSRFWLRPSWLWQADSLNPLTCSLEIEDVAAVLTEHIRQASRAERGSEGVEEQR